MKLRDWLAAILILVAIPAQAAPTIRGLFVGIDKYRYSRDHVANADFNDLKGAVADAIAIKRALGIAYGLNLDQPVAGKCQSSNATSITLTDDCATRAAILGAFAKQIKVAAAGDTILFYFAGHGSQLADDDVFDQVSGYNSTLLPTDARQPDAERATEILDREIRALIDIASARGINVVTIFDSCNSGTAARMGAPSEGWSRGVDMFTGKPPVPIRFQIPVSSAGGSGYRVHFGAARDDEAAREVTSGNTVNGVFTTAFAQAIVARPDATFGDIATTVRLAVERMGHKDQHPQAEGALRATFAGGATQTALFEAEPSADGVVLGAGRMLGMTAGSKFAFYASEADALSASAQPLARGSIASLDDGQSLVTLDTPPPAPLALSPLPAHLVARETEHVWEGAGKLRVSMSGPQLTGESRLVAAIRALPFVELVGADERAMLTVFSRSLTDDGEIMVFARDGTGISSLGEVGDPQFAARLRQVMLTIYNAERLVTLPSRPLDEAGIRLCLSHQVDHPVQSCPEPVDRQLVLTLGRPLVLTLANAADSARYVTVLVIDNRYGITRLIPAHNGRDPPMAPNAIQRTPKFKLDSRGLYRFIVITSDVPIATGALEQPEVWSKNNVECVFAPGTAPGTANACPLTSKGVRKGGIPELGAWTISIKDALVD